MEIFSQSHFFASVFNTNTGEFFPHVTTTTTNNCTTFFPPQNVAEPKSSKNHLHCYNFAFKYLMLVSYFFFVATVHLQYYWYLFDAIVYFLYDWFISKNRFNGVCINLSGLLYFLTFLQGADTINNMLCLVIGKLNS